MRLGEPLIVLEYMPLVVEFVRDLYGSDDVLV